MDYRTRAAGGNHPSQWHPPASLRIERKLGMSVIGSETCTSVRPERVHGVLLSRRSTPIGIHPICFTTNMYYSERRKNHECLVRKMLLCPGWGAEVRPLSPCTPTRAHTRRRLLLLRHGGRQVVGFRDCPDVPRAVTLDPMTKHLSRKKK